MLARLALVFLITAVAGAAQGQAAASVDVSRSTVAARPSSYGRILFDGRGFVLYAFTKDRPGRSACAGPCAQAWPPYLVQARAKAGPGVMAGRLGTTKRADGRLQVTYAGRPLYYYVGDPKPGQILCQNVREFGGLWLVVRPDGRLVR
jgi:predicted lipoprotein with Yx(FWY)xxD motif